MLAGSTWQTIALRPRGLWLVRRNGEYHLFDVRGTVGVVTNASGSVLASDLFGVLGELRQAHGQAPRHGSGKAGRRRRRAC